MSLQVLDVAYRTRLGNTTAKNVLIVLAHEVSDSGSGWPSMRCIANESEASPRTVQRMVEVFEEIGLLARAKSMNGGFIVQMNLEMLGRDLSAAFAKAYAEAQGKVAAL